MMSSLFSDLAAMGLARGYERYIVNLEPVLAAMSRRGMPVTPARYDEVKAELGALHAEAEREMQALIPDDVRVLREHKRKPSVRLPWKPSHDGLIRYMKWRGHPVPKDFKSDKPTTAEDELVRLARTTKDPLYSKVLEYRQVGTVLNNHIKNWKPHGDGRVHPTFYYDTGTGQLAARRPNTMNAPAHANGSDLRGRLNDKFRSMVEAEDGKTLVNFDYKSFHAQTLAWEAEDKDYLRLAKLDIHSYLTAYLVRDARRDQLLGYEDQELAEALRDIKKMHRNVRDGKAKRAILGYGFGMGYRKLYFLNRDSFDSQADAKRVVDTLNGLFPRACQWRENIRKQAHDQGYLISRFGCIRWFWEVFRWEGGGWKPGGEDSEAAIAFLPANDAFCHIKEAMLRLEAGGYLAKYGLVNQIHDALMFECPDPLVEECVATVRATMEQASDILVRDGVGLQVNVGVARGKRWNSMLEIG